MMDLNITGSEFIGFMPKQVEPEIFFFTPALIFYLILTYLILFKVERAALKPFMLSFTIKIFAGYLLAHYFIPDDAVGYYSNYVHYTIYGKPLIWVNNLFFNIIFNHYKFFGQNIFNIILMNSFLATLGALLTYKILCSFQKEISKTKIWLVSLLPIWIYLGILPEKECLVSFLLILTIFVSTHINKKKKKSFSIGNIILFVGIKLRAPMFFPPLILFNFLFYVGPALTKTLTTKIRKILAILICITIIAIGLKIFINQNLYIISLEKIKIEKNHYNLEAKERNYDSVNINRSTFINFTEQNIKYGVAIYGLNFIRCLFSPSPLKPLRDLIFKKDQITPSSFIDCVFNGLTWYIFFPFSLIGLFYYKKSKIYIFSFLTLLFNFTTASLNDIIGNPQFMRYRLPGLVIVSLLGIIALYDLKKRRIILFDKIIIYSWLAGCISFQVIYFYFS